MKNISNNRLVNNFIKLVQIDSPSGEETELADYLVNFLIENVDLVTEDPYGNVYARLEGVGKSIFLSAHMDTVEPGRGVKPIVKNGYLQSDGTTILGVDNKAAIACLLEAIQILKDSKLQHHPIELIFTRCEETDGSGVNNLEYTKITSKVGFCFDYCSPVGTVITVSPFYDRCDIRLESPGAHSSKPETAVNILKILNQFLSQIELGRINHMLFNIGRVEVGEVRNSIPAVANIMGEIRSFDERAASQHKAVLRKILEKICLKEGVSFSLEVVRENPGYIHSSKKALRLIQETLQKISACSIKPAEVESWGVSDANILNSKGLLCLNLGDGGENAHTKKERIRISELTNLTNLIIKLVT